MIPTTAFSGEPQNLLMSTLTPKRLETPGLVNCVLESPSS